MKQTYHKIEYSSECEHVMWVVRLLLLRYITVSDSPSTSVVGPVMSCRLAPTREGTGKIELFVKSTSELQLFSHSVKVICIEIGMRKLSNSWKWCTVLWLYFKLRLEVGCFKLSFSNYNNHLLIDF